MTEPEAGSIRATMAPLADDVRTELRTTDDVTIDKVSRHPGASEGVRLLGPAAEHAASALDDTDHERVLASSTSSSTEPVPDDVRTEMRTAYGVDIDKVHRGPEVSEEASRLGARAFARSGEMFVPPEAGRLDTPQGRSIVAHELTHVSQQRRTGGLLPPEDTAAGQKLEAEAQEAERFFRGDPGAPRPGSSPKADDADVGRSNAATDESGLGEARALMEKLVSDGIAVSDGHGGILFTQPAPRGSSTGVQRQIAAAPLATSSALPFATPGLSQFENPVRGVGQDLAGFGNDILTSGAGLGVGLSAVVAKARNETERDLAIQEFREVTLEHRKTQFLTEHKQSSLSSDDEQALEREVQEEVERRLLELESRVNMRLDLISRQRSAEQGMPAEQGPEGRAEPPVLDPDRYRFVVRRVFGDPASPLLADDTSDVNTAALLGLGRQAITQAGPFAGSETGGAATAAVGAIAPRTGTTPAGFTSRGADRGAPGGTMFPDAQEQQVILPTGRRGGALDRVGALPAADKYADLADHAAGATTSEETGGAALADVATRAAFAATVTTTAAAELVGGAREFASAGVSAIGPAGVGQAAVGSTGHEQLDLDHLDLDELSARIYGRLRRRLRAELLIDRERAGLLTDFH